MNKPDYPIIDQTTLKILENMPQGLMIVGFDKQVKFINDFALKLMGYDRDDYNEIPDKTCHHFVCPSEVDNCPFIDLNLKINAKKTILIRKDKKENPIVKTCSIVMFEGAKALLETFIDISEWEKSKEEIKKKDNFIETVFESLDYPFYVIDVNTYEVLMSNKSAKNRSPNVNNSDQIKCHKLIYNSDSPCGSQNHPCPMEKVKNTKRSVIIESMHTNKDEIDIPVEIHAHPIFDTNGEVVQMIEYTIDISERKSAEKEKNEMQKQVFQSGKLASIGVLASGVAHELNNPLTAILGFSSYIETKSKDKKTVELIGKISKSAYRMKSIIDHLRVYSRKPSTKDWRQVDINEVIDNAFILLGKTLTNNNIETNLNFQENISTFFGDPNQLESIFQNLVTNSIDAFETCEDLEDKLISFTTKVYGQNIVIIYEDNAGGMRPEVVDKMFDPFYTTKEIGKGTGLGMSISMEIISKHKGKMSVQSEDKKGTIFNLVFPIIQQNNPINENNEATQEPITVKANPDLKKKKILAIDDEDIILELLSESLSDDFIIETVTDSKIAIEKIEKDNYDLIITDIFMPNLSGIEVIKKIKEMGKVTPIIVISGNSEQSQPVKDAIEAGAAASLAKPFTDIKNLANVIKQYIK